MVTRTERRFDRGPSGPLHDNRAPRRTPHLSHCNAWRTQHPRQALHTLLHSFGIPDYVLAVTTTLDPLTSGPPTEIPLRNAPLVRVVAAVRFPIIAAIEQRGFMTAFQEAIRAEYPVLRPETTKGVVVGPQGVAAMPEQTIWRFADVEGAWRVSLAPDFMALETTAYRSRQDFLDRLKEAVDALDEHVQPKVIDRFGVRYIDRITGQAADEIVRLVRPEVSGIATSVLAPHVQHAISEVLLNAGDDAGMLARWGRLPPNATVDPSAMEPVAERSWILDIDMFSSKPSRFEPDQLLNKAGQFAERIYTFFRWVVTEEFLRRYGGEL